MQTCAGLHRRETYQCVVPRVTNDECTYGVGGRLGDRCVYKAIERNGNIKKVQSSGLTWPSTFSGCNGWGRGGFDTRMFIYTQNWVEMPYTPREVSLFSLRLGLVMQNWLGREGG